MATITLGTGEDVLVDDEDVPLLSLYCWTRHISGGGEPYIRGCLLGEGKPHKWVYLHRLIMGSPKVFVDHINRNVLDNRKSNLRPASRSQNGANRKRHANNYSGYKGVGYRKRVGRWVARIGSGDSREFLGLFSTAEEAAAAYDVAARIKYGEYSRLNFPDPSERGVNQK